MNLLWSLLTSAILILDTMVCSFTILITSVIPSRPLQDALVTIWCRSLLFFGGVKVVKYGFENLPPVGTGVIYVFNHRSHFDIPVIHGVLPRSFRFGAKAELFDIPFFGWAMMRGRALRIERTNLRSVMEVYASAKLRIDAGESFILAPEGTRQSGVTSVGEFKSGPFILAIQAQALIVPIVLKHVDRIVPKDSALIKWGIKDRSVMLQVLKPISTSGLNAGDRVALKDQVQKLMKDAYLAL